jgi:hypothetical protein
MSPGKGAISAPMAKHQDDDMDGMAKDFGEDEESGMKKFSVYISDVDRDAITDLAKYRNELRKISQAKGKMVLPGRLIRAWVAQRLDVLSEKMGVNLRDPTARRAKFEANLAEAKRQRGKK